MKSIQSVSALATVLQTNVFKRVSSTSEFKMAAAMGI